MLVTWLHCWLHFCQGQRRISSVMRLCGTAKSPKSRDDNTDSSRRCSSRLRHVRSSRAITTHALAMRDRTVASLVLPGVRHSTAAAFNIAPRSSFCIASLPIPKLGITRAVAARLDHHEAVQRSCRGSIFGVPVVVCEPLHTFGRILSEANSAAINASARGISLQQSSGAQGDDRRHDCRSLHGIRQVGVRLALAIFRWRVAGIAGGLLADPSRDPGQTKLCARESCRARCRRCKVSQVLRALCGRDHPLLHEQTGEGRELPWTGNHRQARDGAGMRSGRAAEGIRPAEHVTLATAGSAYMLKASLDAQVFATGGD